MELFKQITANNIVLKPYPFLKELAMEAYLIENQEILKLDDANFAEVWILDAEIALTAWRKDKDGRVDILASYGSEYLAIVELKINQIGNDALCQLQEYLEQRDQILNMADDKYWLDKNISPKWIGVLVWWSIDPSLQKMLSEWYTYKDTPIAGIVLKRFRSDDNQIYVISDAYFKYSYSQKDYSKFLFNNQVYNKARLVLAVIKSYVDQHPWISSNDLRLVFPENLQWKLYRVFKEITEAQDMNDRYWYQRYYTKPWEIIQLSDSTIAISNQWWKSNIKNFIDHAKKVLWMDIWEAPL